MSDKTNKHRPQRSRGVTIGYSLDGDSSKIPTMFKNISAEGICFVVPENPDTGSVIFLDIRFPNEEEAIKVKAEVAWVKESDFLHTTRHKYYDVGAKFIELDVLSHKRIAHYLYQSPTD